MNSHNRPTSFAFSTRLLLQLYEGLWRLIRPCLRLNERLRSGYEQRTLQTLPPRADLWIQAASVGEAYLAWEVVRHLDFQQPTTILLTTNTSQGLDILKKVEQEEFGPCTKAVTAYFPFDQPSLMARALAAITPRTVVLLESELWPGLLAECKKRRITLLVINGRLTQRSLKRYLSGPAIWNDLRPHGVLAMSQEDGGRFASLFGADIVETMHNMKFDRLKPPLEDNSATDNPLAAFIPPHTPFVVLGSVRQEEEADIAHLVAHLKNHNTALILGLFPRHLHRLPHWQKSLDKMNLAWQLRSCCSAMVQPGTIILWDTMGELEKAYDLARAAFVGGSLAPLGGQNFLEPLSCGIRPVIGPHWTNFSWIGREIITQGLVHEAQDWQEVARYLLEQAHRLPDRLQTGTALKSFVRSRQGGTRQACEKIKEMLGPPTA